MLVLLWLVPALPLLSFATLLLCAGRLPKTAAAAIGAGSVGLSAALAVVLAISYLGAPPAGGLREVLWQWIEIGQFRFAIALRLDALSLVMMLIVSCVGFLIHLYSCEFMGGDEGLQRFFTYMNLFVAAMLVLVLADDLLLLYAGWEGVGLCSYLLIGFWYRDLGNDAAARKAFIVTRIGDTAMILGLILLFTELGTADIGTLLQRAGQTWPVGSATATLAAALLLGGAVGKSAQLPLQTWLPDAMAGPTPVSALIHAATMVTAGVYLIARTHALFALAPAVELAVAVIGATTLLLAASSALAQHDLKRILAYSTMSQIGYMFLALGVGAWTAAIFHLFTHALFKALLFLAAGAVMMRIEDEHDIRRMGGLWRRLPLAFVSFLAGAASLAALPLVTAGFYSKDLILWGVFTSVRGGPILWAAGLIGAFLTSLYIFRATFLVFFGALGREPTGRAGWCIVVPLAVLTVASLGGGFLQTPAGLGSVGIFSGLLAPVLPAEPRMPTLAEAEPAAMAVASLIALAGVYVAYLKYLRASPLLATLSSGAFAQALRRTFLSGWGFDALYATVLVRPFTALARLNRGDVVDAVYGDIAQASRVAYWLLSQTVTGRLRWYTAWLAAGSLAAIAIVVFT